MRYLLDTCVLIWALEDNKDKLGDFNKIIQEPRNFIAVSVVSYWEIAIKKVLKKLSAPNNVVEAVEDAGFTWINLETKHIAELEKLPLYHYDPFDRLLITQAKIEELKLLTVDKVVQRYCL